jgi:proteasome lid subunit RPN8/RPN11
MVDRRRHPAYAVFHNKVIHQVEEQLLTTAARHGTEDAACLYGYVVRDIEGRLATWVLTSIAAICNASSIMVEILPETFQKARQHLLEAGNADQVLVGWWHSQPGLGIYPSSEDSNSMHTYFKSSCSLMIISDPHSGEQAVYAWQTGNNLHRIPYATFVGDPIDYLDLGNKSQQNHKTIQKKLSTLRRIR